MHATSILRRPKSPQEDPQDLTTQVQRPPRPRVTITETKWVTYEDGEIRMEVMVFDKDEEGVYRCRHCGARPGEDEH
ncbi:hypothetical protein HMI54_010105 [Coelomomyces lativittatus]|nr:hypothetical protein HMI54_010105 [Coelomomyces lativittatus]